jgi:hypothetical protein
MSVVLTNSSRMKDTPLFVNPDGTQEFGLYVPPPECDAIPADTMLYTVRESDAGNLDAIAVQYYGPGNEKMWWFIASFNGLLSPDFDLHPGDTLLIPPHRLWAQYKRRSPYA